MSGHPVVTGIGVAAPNGLGLDDWWDATLHGRAGIAPVRRFDPERYPAKLAGEIPGFDPRSRLPGRLLPQTDHMTRLALVAADFALADAALDPSTQPEFSVGIVTAATAGGYEFGQRELEHLWRLGPQHVSAYQSFAWFYAVNTGQVSIRNNLRGPAGVLVNDQAGGLDAVAQAARHLDQGAAAMVTGGVDGSLCPWGWIAHLSAGGISRRTDPATAYRPFDVDACGYVPGEGGALLVIEDPAAATARGAPNRYGEIRGYAATFDPPPGSQRPPTLARAIRNALAAAALQPGDIDVVFADAAGIAELDRTEADAIVAVFGPAAVPVTAPKSMTGRLGAGAGPLDVAAALLSIRDSVLPPTVNVDRPDPGYRLDLVVGRPRRQRVRTALVVTRGVGGFNSAMIVSEEGAECPSSPSMT